VLFAGALIVGTGKLIEELLVVLLIGEGGLQFTVLLAVEITLVVGTATLLLLEIGNGGVITAAAAVRAAAKFMVAAEILMVEMLEPVAEVVAVAVVVLEEELEILEVLEVEAAGVVLILAVTGGVTEIEIGLVAGVVEGRSIIKVLDSIRGVGSKRGGISALITERRGSLLLT